MSDNQVSVTPVAVSNSASTPDSSNPPAAIRVDLTPKASPSADVQPGTPSDASTAADTAPPSSEPPAAAEDPRVVARFKELSKRDKQIREREQALKAKDARIAQLDAIDRLAKEDPLALMEQWGVTYEDVTGRILSRFDKDPQLSAVEKEIAALKKAQADKEVSEQQVHIERAINGLKHDIRSLVDTGVDDFELIRTESAYEDVYDVIEQHFAQSGELIPIERAAGLVEEYLLGEATRIAKAKKVQALYAPKGLDADLAGDIDAKKEQPGAAARPGAGVEAQAVVSTPVTLTNGIASSANPSPQSSQLTVEDSKRRAAALLKFR